MTLMLLSMAPFCLLGQDDSNKVQYDFFGHVMPVLALHDVDDITSSTSAFVVQDDQNEMKHDFFSHLTLLSLALAVCVANSIVNSNILFIRSTQSK